MTQDRFFSCVVAQWDALSAYGDPEFVEKREGLCDQLRVLNFSIE